MVDYSEYDAIVVGAGLAGATVARQLANHGMNVHIVERRNHIGGNMYDYVNEEGILVHKYGPHTFHTNNRELAEFVKKFADWKEYYLRCGAVIDGCFTPTPFNFKTLDTFWGEEKSFEIKRSINKAYGEKSYAYVLEMLTNSDENIREFASFLYAKDYSLYSSKQWGIPLDEIDPSIFKRVPIRFNYEENYFDDEYQMLPCKSYEDFFSNLLMHDNISIELGRDAIEIIKTDEEKLSLLVEGKRYEGKVVYTGALDEFFGGIYGYLPYRTLKFEWRYEKKSSFQCAPIVAYPQQEGFTRITEYTKLPKQEAGEHTVYAIEYPMEYTRNDGQEPYYPILTEQSKKIYNLYKSMAKKYSTLYLCGRLAEFKYFNMDEVLGRALKIADEIIYNSRSR